MSFRVVSLLNLKKRNAGTMKQYSGKSGNYILSILQERAKELRCLFDLHEILKNKEEAPLQEILNDLVKIIPPAFKHPSYCSAKIIFEDLEVSSEGFETSDIFHSIPIYIEDRQAGSVNVYYRPAKEIDPVRPFLREELQLLKIISHQLESFIIMRRLRSSMDVLEKKKVPEGMEDDARGFLFTDKDEHWRWREEMAVLMAETLDMERFGVKAVYLIGSTKTGQAGPGSDIDLLVHCQDDELQKEKLRIFFQGWGLCLSELNYQKTGMKTPGSLVDLHLITDKDIEKKTSFTVMLESHTNSAKLLRKARHDE